MIAAFALCGFVAAQAQVKVGDKAPDFAMASINGDTIRLSQFKGKSVLIDFWASWCGPCMMLAPTVAQIAEEYAGRIKVCKVNVDEEPDLAAQYGVNTIPYLLVFKNGEKKAEFTGLRQANVLVEALKAADA